MHAAKRNVLNLRLKWMSEGGFHYPLTSTIVHLRLRHRVHVVELDRRARCQG
jgi:hypothetical protein